MISFKNISIKKKLIIIIISTSTIALIVGLTVYLFFDMAKARSDMKKNARLNASLIGQYAAAPLLFGYNHEAEEVLSKLKAIPSISDACLFSAYSQEILARYHKSVDSTYKFPVLKGESATFDGNYLHIFYPIQYEKRYCGTIYMRISTQEIRDRFYNRLTIIDLLIVFIFLTVLLVASQVQKMISVPILNLAKLTESISKNQDFNIQLTKYGNDEVGVLYQQYNNLLFELLKKKKERDQAEESLIESEAHFRFLFEQSPAIMLIYELVTLRILSVNGAFISYYGYAEEEITKMRLPDLYPEDEKEAILELINHLSGLEYVGEWHHIKKDGLIITVEVYSHGFIAEENAARIAVITDITKRKNTENEIRLLNAELEKKVLERTAQLENSNKELEAFSYSVSHDLRAPLRHINGYLELLAKKNYQQLDEKGKHYMNSITEASTHMGVLIDDLLNFSRTGRVELKIDKMDMNRAIKDTLKILDPESKDRSINWKTSEMPFVDADYSMIRQVWVNLVGNAIKYTKNRDTALIELGYYEEANENIFYIRDNGAGFDMNYAQKLFGVFQRLHASDQFEGTGIGLANVKQIIKRHKGRVWAEGEVDKGATFYFSLPK